MIIFLTINHLQQFLVIAQAGLVVIQGRRPPEDCGVGAGCKRGLKTTTDLSPTDGKATRTPEEKNTSEKAAAVWPLRGAVPTPPPPPSPWRHSTSR